jgi:hypothetical protein
LIGFSSAKLKCSLSALQFHTYLSFYAKLKLLPVSDAVWKLWRDKMLKVAEIGRIELSPVELTPVSIGFRSYLGIIGLKKCQR